MLRFLRVLFPPSPPHPLPSSQSLPGEPACCPGPRATSTGAWPHTHTHTHRLCLSTAVLGSVTHSPRTSVIIATHLSSPALPTPWFMFALTGDRPTSLTTREEIWVGRVWCGVSLARSLSLSHSRWMILARPCPRRTTRDGRWRRWLNLRQLGFY